MSSGNNTPGDAGSNEHLEDDADARNFELSQKAERFLRVKKIRDQLCEAVYNQDDNSPVAQFITLSALRTIWTSQILKDFLTVLGHNGEETPVKIIREGLIKTISILVHMRWEHWAKFESIFFPGGWDKLVCEDRMDKNMPYTRTSLVELLGNGSAAADFLKHQSTYLPWVIKQFENAFVPSWRPLPFIKSERMDIGTGGFGTVTREVIARYHFSGPDIAGHYTDFRVEFPVARKRFQAGRHFRKERANLDKLASILSRHERLVRPHAFITTGDENDAGSPREFNIILPMADTDLKKLLYGQQFTKHCEDLVQLLYEARNLLDALVFLHSSHIIDGDPQKFCHMDLKLDNILVFELKETKWQTKWPAGCWKISDFGISSTSPLTRIGKASQQFSAANLPTITGNTALITNPREAGPYSAPEVHQGRMVGTSSDVWSIGCILFQILVRGAGGIDYLVGMDAKRATGPHDYFYRDMPGPHLHEKIQEWLDNSHFIGHSKDRGIILGSKKLIKKALELNPQRRATAIQLRDELAAICKQDRNPAESKAGSPTTPNHQHGRTYSGSIPFIPEQAQPFPAQSQHLKHLEERPSTPKPFTSQAAERMPSQSSYPRPRPNPPTPPDDHPDISTTKLSPAHADPLAIDAGLLPPVDTQVLPNHRAWPQLKVPGRLSSKAVTTINEVPRTILVSNTQPPVSMNNLKPKDASPDRCIAPDPQQERSMSVDPRNFQSTEHAVMSQSQISPGHRQMLPKSNTLGIVSSSSAPRIEDNSSRESHKATRLFHKMHIFQDKIDKGRSLSLPAVLVTAAPCDPVDGPPSQIQRFSTPERPLCNHMLSEPTMSHSQGAAPSLGSVTSSDENEIAIEHHAELNGDDPSPASAQQNDNVEEQRSISSDILPQHYPPVAIAYWTEQHTKHQIARGLSGRSSVPSVNVGDAKVHNFLNISKDTIVTLVSSTAAKVAFISPRGVDVATLYDPGCRTYIKPPENVVWERGSLAGNFLALQGCHTPPGRDPTPSYPLYFYELQARLATGQRLLQIDKHSGPKRLPRFDKFDVSRDGKLLIGGFGKIYLGRSLNEEPEELQPNLERGFLLRRVWFSTSGLIAFAWSSGPNNRHRINWWEVEVQRLGRIKYQIIDNPTGKIKVIHFPKSPLCILWQDHTIYLLQEAAKPDVPLQPCPFLKLQAVVVTPNEDAVVFIRSSSAGFKKVSKVVVCPIGKKGDYFYIDYDRQNSPEQLQNFIAEPDKCEVVIQEYEGSRRDIKVLIAQGDGKFEVKELRL